MSAWQKPGQSDEWWTPGYVFDALGCSFDLDVAAPPASTHVPASCFLTADALDAEWRGFVWMNAPFGGRNGLVPWLEKFAEQGNAVALVPDRTSAPWFQSGVRRADMILFVDGKIRFLRPDGSEGKSPGDGTALFAIGPAGCKALTKAAAAGLGFLVKHA